MNENDLQKQTDVEQAKARLEEIEATKEGRKDPRAGENTLIPARRKLPEKGEKNIRQISGKPKKKRFSQKLKEAMFSDDIGNGSVSDYVFFKILIPSVKRVLSDMANTAINMALGLDPKTRTISSNTHTANASVYRDRNYSRGDSAMYNRRNAISEYEWSDEDAKDIYLQICEIIEHYGEISIADVYSIMGLGDKIRTTDRNWGWTDTRNIEVTSVDKFGDRWIIDMPSAKPLN